MIRKLRAALLDARHRNAFSHPRDRFERDAVAGPLRKVVEKQWQLRGLAGAHEKFHQIGLRQRIKERGHYGDRAGANLPGKSAKLGHDSGPDIADVGNDGA